MVKFWPEGQDIHEFEFRRNYLYSSCDYLFLSGLFSKSELRMVEERFDNIVSGYFILSENYKSLRIRPGARTKNSKIAALMSLSILTFDPVYSPLPPKKDKNLLANEIFSLMVSTEIADFKIDIYGSDSTVDPHKQNFWFRAAEQLRFARYGFGGLTKFRVDCENHSVNHRIFSDYLSDFTEKDMEYIVSTINLFERLEGKATL
jgi:hypothetical protein